jgi:hypothetical protein
MLKHYRKRCWDERGIPEIKAEKIGLLDEANELEQYKSLYSRNRAISRIGQSKPFP